MPSTDIALEVFYGGAWHDLVMDEKVLADQAITITRGDGAESAAPRPASLTTTLNNRDDMFRLSNPESPLYGRVGRNTPIRASVDGAVRAATEATLWQTGQSRAFRPGAGTGNAWVDVESGGLLQRVNNWTEPLRGPMTRYSSRLPSQLGNWPLEDESTAQSPSNLTAGGDAGAFSVVELGSDDTPPGASSSAKMTDATGAMSGTFLVSTASGWQVSVCMRLPTVPGGAAQDLLRIVDSIGRNWVLKISGSGYDFDAVGADGVLIQSVNTAHSVSPVKWVRFSLKVSISGGTITMRQQRSEANGSGVFGTSATFSGTTTSQPRTWRIAGNSYTAGAWFCGVLGVSQAVDDLMFSNGSFLASFGGHIGERTRDRFGRIMNEEVGLGSWTTIGTTALSATMGIQRPGTLAELLREIRDTEDGLIYDARTATQLVFRLRTGRYNRTAVTIDVADLPTPPDEVTDDLGVHNAVTVVNGSGEESYAVDTTGPLGTASPPTGVGEYRQDVDVNVGTIGLLPQHANWWLRRGTVDLPRYPRVRINLDVLTPAKRAEILGTDIGEVLEITGYRENTIRLFVIGYTEVIPWKASRFITFTCAPDQQFNVGTYGTSATQRRYDMKTATTAAEYGPGATTIVFSITADEAWSTTSAFDIMISGERIGIPAGAMGARTGSLGAYSQTATGVLRSRNGVRKTLPVASSARVFEQGRWAL